MSNITSKNMESAFALKQVMSWAGIGGAIAAAVLCAIQLYTWLFQLKKGVMPMQKRANTNPLTAIVTLLKNFFTAAVLWSFPA